MDADIKEIIKERYERAPKVFLAARAPATVAPAIRSPVIFMTPPRPAFCPKKMPGTS